MADIKYIVPFTLKWEGGLANAKTDTASKNPSPWNWTDPKTKVTAPAHTNKGVTYAAFKSAADKYGFANTQDNFFKMPEDIWLKITKGGYWDKLNMDAVKSQAVANVIFSWQWGSGYAWVPRISKYLASKGINWTGGNWVGKTFKVAPDFNQISTKLNELINKIGEKQAVDDLLQQKKEFLLSLSQAPNGPNPGGVYTKGWLNRLADLQKYNYSLLGQAVTNSINSTMNDIATTTEVVKKNPLKIAILLAATITGIILTIKAFKK